MKLFFKFILPALVIFFLFANSVSARSGCCSHHGGVCGCGCCDGSALSNTCAPYYPECGEPVYIPSPTIKPITYTPIPTPELTLTPQIVALATQIPSLKLTSTVNSKFLMARETVSGLFFIVVLLGLTGWVFWK